jgi:hypothetical protein
MASMSNFDFTILNWNIGGAKYLEESENKRVLTREKLNGELKELINRKDPHVVTLQEIVRYGKAGQKAEDIIDPIKGYNYHSFPLIDSHRLSSRAKWNKVRKSGKWGDDISFSQGNAMLIRNDVHQFPVWDLAASSENIPKVERPLPVRDLAISSDNIPKVERAHYIEQVNIESGLYFGDRNTEPRAALVTHFIYNPLRKNAKSIDKNGKIQEKNGKPVDIFVINVHLTTLTMEREGIPEIDLEASKIRLSQLDIIFRGIISRYNIWKQQGYPERQVKPKKPQPGDTFKRFEPVWIIAGDFNFTPNSIEYKTIKRLNFIDVVPGKGNGTKAKGAGNPATLTVDYIFAGPKFIALDYRITKSGIADNNVNHDVKGSDHYPMFAKIPILLNK